MIYLAQTGSAGLWIFVAGPAGILLGVAGVFVMSRVRSSAALNQAKRILADAKEEA